MNLVMKIILGALIIAALVLGYKIYEKKTASSEPRETSSAVDSSESNTAAESIKEADAAEMAVLRDYFKTDASADEKQRYFDLVNTYAVATTTLDITKCLSNPFVAAAQQGGKLTLVNNGTTEEIIRFDSTREYAVAAGSFKVITLDFKYGEGAYGYNCPSKAGVAGIILTRSRQ